MRHLLWLTVLAHTFSASARAADPTYWQDVRPILRKHCTACHLARKLDEPEVSGGLALDSYGAVHKGSKRPVIRPGKSSESLLVELLTTKDEDKRMPIGSPALPVETIELLRRWIDTGAKEGEKPAGTETTIAASPSRARKLDVTLSTSAQPPRGVFGNAAPARLDLALKVGPLAPVTAVAFSPDGKLLASGTYGLVTLWDVATAKPVRAITSVLGTVNDLRFSPDGKLLAVAGGQPAAKGDLRLYSTADWKLHATLAGHEDVVFGVAFSSDGKRLASASFDKTVRIWDVFSHKLERALTGHSDFVYAVAFAPDGKWVASASKDRSVKMTDLATGKGMLTFSLDDDVMAVAVSPDGKAVLSSGFQPSLYWWNTQDGGRIRAQGGHGVAVHELGFSKDGKQVISASSDRTVRLWDASTGAMQRSLSVGSITYAAALSGDGKRVASGSYDGLVRLWDAASGRLLLTLLAVAGTADSVEWVAVAPEGYAAASPSLTSLVRWQMGTQSVPADAAWKVLGNADAIAKAARGETLTAPAFQK